MLDPSACASKPGFTAKAAENTRRSLKFEQASSAPLTYIGLSPTSRGIRVRPKCAAAVWSRRSGANDASAHDL